MSAEKALCFFVFWGHPFPCGNGNGGHVGDIKHSFTSACKKAGITDSRFHDLRHTYASHLAMIGVHIRALQELLGHKTLAMTQRYSHLAPEQLQNAVKMLDGVIGEKRELIACETPDV